MKIVKRLLAFITVIALTVSIPAGLLLWRGKKLESIPAPAQENMTLTATIRREGSQTWHDSAIILHPGVTYEVQVQYLNQDAERVPHVALQIALPDTLTYQPGTLEIWNVVHPTGYQLPDNTRDIMHSVSLLAELGSYAPGANAYVTFKVCAKERTTLLLSNTRELRVSATSDDHYLADASVLRLDCLYDSISCQALRTGCVLVIILMFNFLYKHLTRPVTRCQDSKVEQSVATTNH